MSVHELELEQGAKLSIKTGNTEPGPVGAVSWQSASLTEVTADCLSTSL